MKSKKKKKKRSYTSFLVVSVIAVRLWAIVGAVFFWLLGGRTVGSLDR
jgi:cytoskeletal protein RodZ